MADEANGEVNGGWAGFVDNRPSKTGIPFVERHHASTKERRDDRHVVLALNFA